MWGNVFRSYELLFDALVFFLLAVWVNPPPRPLPYCQVTTRVQQLRKGKRLKRLRLMELMLKGTRSVDTLERNSVKPGIGGKVEPFYSFIKARPDTEKKEHLAVNINIHFSINSCYIWGLIDVAEERKDKDWALQLKFVQVPLFPTLLKWQNMARQCPRLLAACLSDLANGNVSPNFSSRCQSNIFFGAKSHSSLCSDPLPVLRFLLNSDLPDFASLATLSINAHSCQPGPGMAV